MEIGSLNQVWRYPAKSMAGEELDRADFVAGGLVGDRGWAVRDEVRGGIRGAKKIAALMGLSARYLAEPMPGLAPPEIEIDLGTGSTVRSDDPDVHRTLSAALDHEVTLWPLQPADDLDHYRRGAPDTDDLDAELRDLFARTPDEPLPDFGLFPPEVLEFESPPGTYVDAYPVLVITDRSLARLAELAPDSVIDVRRFRPNLVVTTGPSAIDVDWPEQAWVGHSIAVGGAVLDVVGPCPRCVMITRGFDDIPEDRSLMRTVVREAGQNIGVYATVRTPGRALIGDPVHLS